MMDRSVRSATHLPTMKSFDHLDQNLVTVSIDRLVVRNIWIYVIGVRYAERRPMKPDMPWFSSQSGGYFLRNVKDWENGVRRVGDEKMERTFGKLLYFSLTIAPMLGQLSPTNRL
jgi:hypothetical protein